MDAGAGAPDAAPFVRLAFDDTGAGAGTGGKPPWVLLHAFPLHRGMWAPQRAALGARARLVMPDLRGFGASPAPREPEASMRRLAGDVLALCDALGLRRFGVLGLSMGGYVALELHRAAPRRVAAMALVATQAGPDSEAVAARREREARRVEAEGVAPWARELLPRLLAPRHRGGALEARVLALAAGNRPAGVAAALRGMATRADLRSHLPRVTCPVLLVAGAEDAFTGPEVAEATARGLPDGRVVVLPGAGHLVNLEDPEAFHDLLGPFLQAVVAAGAPSLADEAP